MYLFSLKNDYQFTQGRLRNIVHPTVSQTSSLADSFWFRKITRDPHILVHVNKVCADVTYTKFNFYMSELILDRHEYIEVAQVTLHCIA
jgi:hypothetical protein